MEMTKAERHSFTRAMDAWEHSLDRPDMTERDRVKGALLAYVDSYFASVELGERLREGLLDESKFWAAFADNC